MNETWNIILWFKNQTQPWIILIGAFFIAQLVNVILSTIRSVVLIKGGKKLAIIFNVISYSLSALVTALIAGVVKNVPIVVMITAITNAIGVWAGLTIIDKVRKDQLWRISATVRTEFFKPLIKDLSNNNIAFITYNTNWEERVPLDVFSHSRKESSLINSIFLKYRVKYTISTNNHNL